MHASDSCRAPGFAARIKPIAFEPLFPVTRHEVTQCNAKPDRQCSLASSSHHECLAGGSTHRRRRPRAGWPGCRVGVSDALTRSVDWRNERRLAAAGRALPFHESAIGRLAKQETVKIGAVVYKRCVTLGVSDEGLYVSTWGKSALIPWDAFTGVGHATLYWQKLPMLTVGDPPVASIVVPVAVFDLIRSRLSETLKDGT